MTWLIVFIACLAQVAVVVLAAGYGALLWDKYIIRTYNRVPKHLYGKDNKVVVVNITESKVTAVNGPIVTDGQGITVVIFEDAQEARQLHWCGGVNPDRVKKELGSG